jgi:subtilisin family serine protease
MPESTPKRETFTGNSIAYDPSSGPGDSPRFYKHLPTESVIDSRNLPRGGAVARLAGSPGIYKESLPEDIVVEPERYLYLGVPVRPWDGPKLNDTAVTWWLKRVGIDENYPLTGDKAVVAVLDTGVDLCHPDLKNRIDPADTMYLDGKNAHDRAGHGTHCAGIIGGEKNPHAGPRYSVAPGARLLIARIDEDGVLDRRTFDWRVIVALLWAVGKGAHIASLSMGTQLDDDCQPHSRVLQNVARYLLCNHDLVVFAATGTLNDRPSLPLYPIVSPSDCPAMVAVAATDSNDEVAFFSNGAVCEQRHPTLAAPGINIRSARPITGSPANLYIEMDGTSQATPIAAGIGALFVEKGFRGQKLIDELLANVEPLPNAKSPNTGAGLVKAP